MFAKNYINMINTIGTTERKVAISKEIEISLKPNKIEIFIKDIEIDFRPERDKILVSIYTGIEDLSKTKNIARGVFGIYEISQIENFVSKLINIDLLNAIFSKCKLKQVC